MIPNERDDSDPMLMIGELRGVLATLAWANGKADHVYSFEFEWLPDHPTIEDSLRLHSEGYIKRVEVIELVEWRAPSHKALHSWLFQQFGSLVKGGSWCAMIDEDNHRDIVTLILHLIEVVVKPSRAVRVLIETNGWYECAWDDFAVLGEAGSFSLHLGSSD